MMASRIASFTCKSTTEVVKPMYILKYVKNIEVCVAWEKLTARHLPFYFTTNDKEPGGSTPLSQKLLNGCNVK